MGLPFTPQKGPGEQEDDEGKDDQLSPHSQEIPLVGDTLMVGRGRGGEISCVAVISLHCIALHCTLCLSVF